MTTPISAINHTTVQPGQKPDPAVKPSSESTKEEAGLTFGEVLSTAPVGIQLTKDLFQTDSTLQIKQSDPREQIRTGQTDSRKTKRAEEDEPIVVVKKAKTDNAPEQIQVNGPDLKEAKILTTGAEVVSLRPEEKVAIEGAQQTEGFFFEALGKYEHLKNEADIEGANPALHELIQQTSTTGFVPTDNNPKFSKANKTTEALTPTAHLANDSSLPAKDPSLEEIATDPRIVQAINRALSPQPTTTAHVQVLTPPVALVPPLASAVPLQFERGSSDAMQPNLIAATVVDGAEKQSQSSGQESSLSREHSGAFAGQRSAETTGAQLTKSTESLSQTSMQQAEKVQALQQVIQDFKQQLSKIAHRPTNLKIHVKHEKFGDVNVKLNFNPKDKTVSATFHADSNEMLQMLSQQRREIEDILMGADLIPTADSIKFYKTNEV